MSRDPDILRVFEITDDSLQGVLGYHLYVTAMQQVTDVEKIKENLPVKQIPITFSWDRFYQKQDLVDAFKLPVFEIYQSRITLIAIVNVFDVALAGFIRYLNAKGHHQSLKNEKLKKMANLKHRIEWAYEQSIKCDIGDKEAIRRLPITFGIVDNARRLRNLIVHNHGLFDENYESDALRSEGIVIEMHEDYSVFKEKPLRPTPLIIASGDIIRFLRAHVEVLHILHNGIQKEYFDFPEPYNYLKENKPIEWERALWGTAKVRVQFTEIKGL